MRLIFTSGSREGQALALDGARLTIGRDADNDVELADERVSRHHAMIERDSDGGLVLRDLGSSNGTFVDDERLQAPRALRGGERIRFGSHQVRVQAPAAATPAEGPAAPPPAGRRVRKRWLVGGGILLGLLVLAGLAQLFLPGLAEDKLRSKLERYGPVQRVHIEASPALKLLAQRADRVEVAMDSYRSDPGGQGSVADFLSDTRKTDQLDARVKFLDADLVTLHDVRLTKDGDAVRAQAVLTQSDLEAALPDFVGVRPVAASDNGIVVRARASALGQSVAVDLRIVADGGKIVVRPEGLPFGSLASLSVFKDPRVQVDRLGARLEGDRYLITASGHLE